MRKLLVIGRDTSNYYLRTYMKNLHKINPNKCECDYPMFDNVQHRHDNHLEKRIRDGRILLLCSHCILPDDLKVIK